MNRTIKTIAGAAVLVSAVSLVPAFSVSAISIDDAYTAAAESAQTITFKYTDAENDYFTVGDEEVLFAFSDSAKASEASIVLSTHSAEVEITTSGDIITFTINKSAYSFNKAFEINTVTVGEKTYKANFVLCNAIRLNNNKITVAEGSSLTIIGAIANSATSIIENNGILTFSRTVTHNFDGEIVNNGTLNISGVDGTFAKIVNNSDIELTKSATVTELENNGNIEVKANSIFTTTTNTGKISVSDGELDLRTKYEGTAESELLVKSTLDIASTCNFSGKINLAGELSDVAANGTHTDLLSAKIQTPTSFGDFSSNINIVPEDYVATIANDSDYSWSLKTTNNGHGTNVTRLELTQAIYEANVNASGSIQNITVHNKETDLASFVFNDGESNITVNQYALNHKPNGTNHVEAWRVLTDATGESEVVTSPKIEAGKTYYAQYSTLDDITVIVVEPKAEGEGETTTVTKHVLVPKSYTTYGEYMLGEFAKELEKYNYELSIKTGATEYEVITDDRAIATGHVLKITFKTKPVEKDPEESGDDEGDNKDDEGDDEEKTPTVTVTGDAEVDATEEELLANIDSSLSLKENAAAAQEISKALADGDNVNFAVEAKELSAEDIDEATLEAIEKKTAGKTVLGFYDISVAARTDDGDLITNITNLDTPLTLKIKLSEEDRKVAEGYSRTYVVVRVHGSDVSILEATLDKDGYLVFESGLFSTYAVAYTDTKIATVTPNDEDEEAPEVVDPTKDATVADGAGFISTEKSAAAAGASIFAIVAAAITAAGVAISKLFKKSER